MRGYCLAESRWEIDSREETPPTNRPRAELSARSWNAAQGREAAEETQESKEAAAKETGISIPERRSAEHRFQRARFAARADYEKGLNYGRWKFLGREVECMESAALLESLPAPVTILTPRLQDTGEIDNEMPPHKDDEMRVAVTAMANAVAAMAQKKNGNGWTQWLPPIMMAGLLIATGVRGFSTTESELRQQVFQAQADAKAATAGLERANGLIDKLEIYNQRTREEFALRGWVIDPATGKITRVRAR